MPMVTDAQLYDHDTIIWGGSVDFPDTNNLRQYTHRVYNRYPARSISVVPRSILANLKESRPRTKEFRVLDPFMGSGTTAVETALQGMTPFGLEVDAFARLISNVRVRAYTPKGIARLRERFELIKTNWQEIDPDESLAPELQNIEYWFTPKIFADLLKVKTAIHLVTGKSKHDREFFEVMFADMIRPCSKAERQSLKPYISTKYPKKPTSASIALEKSFQTHIAALEEYSRIVDFSGWSIEWLEEDATNFNASPVKMDAAITSPPYINALDYVRCVKIESAWVGCGDDQYFAEVRKSQVGDSAREADSVPLAVRKVAGKYIDRVTKKDLRRGKIVVSYFCDMLDNLHCTYRALKEGGAYHIIVGDSVIRDVHIPTHKLIASLAEEVGFAWEGYYYYQIKDHRTSIPRGEQGGKINYEYVVTLVK